MKLTILERILLLNIMRGSQGNVILMRLIRDFLMELSFSEEEYEECKITQLENGQVGWDLEKEPNKEFTIARPVHGEIVKELKKLDDRGDINLGLLELYEKFVPVDEQREEHEE